LFFFVSNSQVIGCEDRLRNGLYCVGWGVKLFSIQSKSGEMHVTPPPEVARPRRPVESVGNYKSYLRYNSDSCRTTSVSGVNYGTIATSSSTVISIGLTLQRDAAESRSEKDTRKTVPEL